MGNVDRLWKVGELARASGLTIRALHHYDSIGLLVPGRTDAGHRVYSGADVERLYRVLALRGVGMALDEIRAVLDDAGVSLMDTVRRHITAVERGIEQRRRLLDRLRDMLDALERSSQPSVDELLQTVEAMTVVEAQIEDVVTRDRWDAVWELQEPYVILLKESGGERILPIWIGQPEAAALVMQRRGITTPRPLGHDLMVALLSAADARVERVVIERLSDNTFFATVTVLSDGEPREVDARPSDALNLAVRANAPIRIASDVIESAGLTTWPGGRGQEPVGSDDPPPWIPVGERRNDSREPTYTIDEDSPALLRRAAAQAHDLGHHFVAPPHLLLGILADEEDPAARLLQRHEITRNMARQAATSIPADENDTALPGGSTRLTRLAMSVMHRASIEARRRGTDISPIHVLLALIDSPGASDTPSLTTISLAAIHDDARSQLDA